MKCATCTEYEVQTALINGVFFAVMANLVIFSDLAGQIVDLVSQFPARSCDKNRREEFKRMAGACQCQRRPRRTHPTKSEYLYLYTVALWWRKIPIWRYVSCNPQKHKPKLQSFQEKGEMDLKSIIGKIIFVASLDLVCSWCDAFDTTGHRYPGRFSQFPCPQPTRFNSFRSTIINATTVASLRKDSAVVLDMDLQLDTFRWQDLNSRRQQAQRCLRVVQCVLFAPSMRSLRIR